MLSTIGQGIVGYTSGQEPILSLCWRSKALNASINALPFGHKPLGIMKQIVYKTVNTMQIKLTFMPNATYNRNTKSCILG